MGTWLSKLVWALRDVIRWAFVGHWGPQPTGPNLVRNPSFEDGNFGSGSETVIQGGTSGVIANWLVLQVGAYAPARWIEISHPLLNQAADGRRFVDLTGGQPISPTRQLAALLQDTGPPVQVGQRYQCELYLGVGPNNGPSENFAGPIRVTVNCVGVSQVFEINPPPPSGTGVTWQRCVFQFTVPAGYVNLRTRIDATKGNLFIGVDHLSVRLLT